MDRDATLSMSRSYSMNQARCAGSHLRSSGTTQGINSGEVTKYGGAPAGHIYAERGGDNAWMNADLRDYILTLQ